MKNKFKSITLLFLMAGVLNSCFISHDRKGRHTDRGKRYPHDEHPQKGNKR